MAAKIVKIALIALAVAVHGFLYIGPVAFFYSWFQSEYTGLFFYLWLLFIALPDLFCILGGAIVYHVLAARETRLTAAAWGAGTSLATPCFAALASTLSQSLAAVVGLALIIAAPPIALWLARRARGAQ